MDASENSSEVYLDFIDGESVGEYLDQEGVGDYSIEKPLGDKTIVRFGDENGEVYSAVMEKEVYQNLEFSNPNEENAV